MARDVRSAGRAVEAAMAARGWNVRDLAREAGVDAGTVGDFLAGDRWPRVSTRGKIEQAVGWEYGTIGQVAEGAPVYLGRKGSGKTANHLAAVQLEEEQAAREAQRLDVVDAILADPYLLPEAKEHFLNQYLLLLRIAEDSDLSDPGDTSSVTHRRRGSLRELPAVARGGRPEHAEEVAAMARKVRARLDRELKGEQDE